MTDVRDIIHTVLEFERLGERLLMSGINLGV